MKITTASLTPSILIDQPGTASETVPTVIHSTSGRPLTPRLITTIYPSNIDSSCYLCDEQNPGDFSPTTKYLERCLLCSRAYCPVHKAIQYENVCNINHSKYYHECLEKARDELAQKSPDGTAKRDDAEDQLNSAGVYPSLGERQKAIFMNSPVSPERIKEIQDFRSLDAEVSGNHGKGSAGLVEERDVYAGELAT